MRFFGIFSRTRENFWLKFHIQIVLNITYNFSIETKLEKFHLHPFWAHFSIWLQSIHAKNAISRKIFKIEASNFPDMFTGPLSVSFVKTVWRFSHIDGSQIKKIHFSPLQHSSSFQFISSFFRLVPRESMLVLFSFSWFYFLYFTQF